MHVCRRIIYIMYLGLAIVLKSKAAFWTDGRYHLQASSQLDKNWTVMKDGRYWGFFSSLYFVAQSIGLPGVPKPEDWLPKVYQEGFVQERKLGLLRRL